MRDQPLERIGAAREEGECRPHVTGRVVEGAPSASPPRSGSGTGRPRAAPLAGGRRRRASSRRAGRAGAPSSHASTVPAASITTSAPSPVPVSAPNAGASACRSGREPTPTGRPPASAMQAQSISPIGPSPITATVSPGGTPAASTPCRQHASGSTIAASSDGSAGGTGRRFVARDPLRDEDELAVGAVEQREEVLAERLLSPLAGARRHHTAPSSRPRRGGRWRRRRRRTRVRRGSAGGRAGRGARGGMPSGRCRP